MEIKSHDVICLTASNLRRMAEEMGRRRWNEISDEDMVEYMFQRISLASVDHVTLCSMFPASVADDTDPTAGRRVVPSSIVVTDAPQYSGFRLFRAFGLDQAILTYFYSDVLPPPADDIPF